MHDERVSDWSLGNVSSRRSESNLLRSHHREMVQLEDQDQDQDEDDEE